MIIFDMVRVRIERKYEEGTTESNRLLLYESIIHI
jgi:hypothetical protein